MSDPRDDMLDESIVALNQEIMAHFARLGTRFEPKSVGYCGVAMSIGFLMAHNVLDLTVDETPALIDEVNAVINKRRKRHERHRDRR